MLNDAWGKLYMEGLREARQACQSAKAKVKSKAISLISEAALASPSSGMESW